MNKTRKNLLLIIALIAVIPAIIIEAVKYFSVAQRDVSTKPQVNDAISTRFPDATQTVSIPQATIGAVSARSRIKDTEYIDHPLPLDAGKTLLIHPFEYEYFTLDSAYVYWATKTEIDRSPLKSPSRQMVAKSKYPAGDLSRMAPIISGDWLIFFDAQDPDQNNFSTWTLRAKNMVNHHEVEIANRLNTPGSFPALAFSADQDRVVWTDLVYSNERHCDESILSIYNLLTERKTQIAANCIEDNYMLTMPDISGNFLVVEQDFSDAKGGGNNLLLFNLQTDESSILSDDRRSSMPEIDIPWVMWKDNERYQPTVSIGIYNIENGQSWTIPTKSHLGTTDPHLSGNYVVWTATRMDIKGYIPSYNTIFLYDLTENKLQRFDAPGETQMIRDVRISGNTMAWLRNFDYLHGSSDGAIDWNTIPSTTSR